MERLLAGTNSPAKKMMWWIQPTTINADTQGHVRLSSRWPT